MVDIAVILTRIAEFLIFFPVFLFSLSFHEASHAWMANKLGDSTARLMGRMTLNPLAHIDWIGTVLFPLMMFLGPDLPLFGWARPVPVNPYNLRGGRKGNLKVALAGPLSNLLLASLLAGLFRVLLLTGILHELNSFLGEIFIKILYEGIFLNLALAFFNLLPIPPLDGSGILEGLLPSRYLPIFDKVSRYGFLILFLFLYMGLFRYLQIPIQLAARVLLP